MHAVNRFIDGYIGIYRRDVLERMRIVPQEKK